MKMKLIAKMKLGIIGRMDMKREIEVTTHGDGDDSGRHGNECTRDN